MDHSEALRLKAAEKYILGELSGDLREQFEEHYFDCPECANDVRALSTFVTASRVVLAEEAPIKDPARERREKGGGWFAWLRPAVAVPAIAALAAVVLFQNAITIPALKKSTVRPAAQVFESSYRLQGSTRGENNSIIAIHGNESIALDFDFTPTQTFSSYQGIILDSAGDTVLSFNLAGDTTNKELHVVVPAGKLRPGNYHLLVVGNNAASSSNPKPVEVQRLSFVVQALP
jgi:hypothetical protein